MKALVCCITAPWPPVSGVDLRCWQILNLLREWAEVGLFALTGKEQPPPGFSAAVWRVTGSAAKALSQTGWMKHETGLPSDAYYDEGSALELDLILRKFAPDVVILDHLWTHTYQEVIRSRGFRLVLDAHNVEGALARQLADQEVYPPAKLQRRRFATRVAAVESDLARGADQIWVCSPEDRRQFLENYVVRAPVRVVPNAVDLVRYAAATANRPPQLDGAQGPIFLFAGAFHYTPNQNAADFLIRELFPRLTRAYPEARLLLAGANPTPQMLRAAAQENRIIVTGQVPDMIPYLQHASVMLVPLFTGGGTRFKIIEAFAVNLPVVSSAKGAEGLGAEPGKHFLLAESPDAFMSAIGAILSAPERTRGLIQSSAELVERFSWKAARETVGLALRELQI